MLHALPTATPTKVNTTQAGKPSASSPEGGEGYRQSLRRRLPSGAASSSSSSSSSGGAMMLVAVAPVIAARSPPLAWIWVLRFPEELAELINHAP